MEINGVPCCKSCHQQIKATRSNVDPRVGVPEPISHPQSAHTGHQNNIDPLLSAQRCNLCGAEIVGVSGSPEMGVKLSNGQVIHAKCFKCADCKREIQGQYVSDGQYHYHPNCRQSVTVTQFGGKQLLCAECYIPIKDAYLQHETLHYHPGCFKCSSCKVSLVDGYVDHPVTKAPICEKCVQSMRQDKPKPVPAYKGGLKPVGQVGFSGTVQKNSCPGCGKQLYQMVHQ